MRHICNTGLVNPEITDEVVLIAKSYMVSRATLQSEIEKLQRTDGLKDSQYQYIYNQALDDLSLRLGLDRE